jgi:hypothetical protein
MDFMNKQSLFAAEILFFHPQGAKKIGAKSGKWWPKKKILQGKNKLTKVYSFFNWCIYFSFQKRWNFTLCRCFEFLKK